MPSVYRASLYTIVCLLLSPVLRGQSFAAAAKSFVGLLSDDQKVKAVLSFDVEERYNFHYIPKDNRKGISINELNERQKQEAFHLLRMGIASETIKKMRDARSAPASPHRPAAWPRRKQASAIRGRALGAAPARRASRRPCAPRSA